MTDTFANLYNDGATVGQLASNRQENECCSVSWRHALVGKRQMEELLVRWNFETWGSLKILPIHLQNTVGRVVMTPSLNRTSTAPLTLSLRPPDKKTPRHLLRVNHSQTQHTQGKQSYTDVPSDFLSNIPHISNNIGDILHNQIYHCTVNTVILSPFIIE